MLRSRRPARSRCFILWLALPLGACATGGSDDTLADVPPADGFEAGPDADADTPLETDGPAPDVPGTDDGTTPDDAAPAEPVCRYECDGDGDCTGIYGAGWSCREFSFVAPRLCLQLCSGDADCRVGAASDPLMVCRAGACAMRPCDSAGECGWAGAGADCRSVDWDIAGSCQRTCGADADCGMGVASDVLYHCEGGLCAWYCETDDDCFAAFGTRAYGCRTPSYEPGPSCIRGCTTDSDCFVGAPSDSMAVCR